MEKGFVEIAATSLASGPVRGTKSTRPHTPSNGLNKAIRLPPCRCRSRPNNSRPDADQRTGGTTHRQHGKSVAASHDLSGKAMQGPPAAYLLRAEESTRFMWV